MAEDCLKWAGEAVYSTRGYNVQHQIDGTSAYIMVDDLNHLVKGGRLSNGAAILGNPIEHQAYSSFNDEGVIEVFEKVRRKRKP